MKISNIPVNACFFIGALFLTVFAACSTGEEAKVAGRDKFIISDSLLHTLVMDTVKKCPLKNAITLTGKVAFNETNVVKIFPMVSGVVSRIKAVPGDYVSKDQTLGVITSIEMAGYSNDLVRAETNLSVTKRNFDQIKDMAASGLASQIEVVTAETAYTQAQSELNKVQSILAINGGDTHGKYIIKAPVNGFIVERPVNNNMVIRTDNGTQLFTVSDLETVWVLANVYESNITKIHEGDSAEITTFSYPGKVFKGKVSKVLNVLDPDNKVMKVRIVLPNPGYLLKPEMFAGVTVTNVENRQALCVPSTALILNNSQYYVLVYKDRSDVRITPIELLNTVGDKTYLSGGIKEGERVICSQTVLIYNQLNY
jgi:cobalt-zinc-cadmium efflux system membrane fusion protein